MDNQIVVYKASDGNELAVKTDGETVSTRVADLCLCRTICRPDLKRMCLTDFSRVERVEGGGMGRRQVAGWYADGDRDK